MTDERFIIDLDFDNIVLRDQAGGHIDPAVIDHGMVQFNVSADFVEQIVLIAKRYAAMREETAHIEAAKGAPIIDPEEDGDKVLGYADGLPKYRFTTRPCFTNLDTITIDAAPADFDPDYTDVIIWDNGDGITFVSEDENGNDIAFGSNRHDLEQFLKTANSADVGRMR
ncbi:hypothetical protein G6L37_06740 [Agrobacterium rubi]|nr:hypothetical protein [Agrobacterium rubi]NTF25061.1 hypothetical protein [Agrobacterium rubi]